MLIKSDPVRPQQAEDAADGQEDKLQERLRLDRRDEEERPGKGRPHSGKHADHHGDRRRTHGSPVPDITEIRPYLLLCGAAAIRGNVLADLQVSCVVNATKELPDTPLPALAHGQEILYLRVNVDDRPESDILSWLDLVADVVHQVKLSGGKTLIHCVAGVSRSATLCLAYLIKHEGLSLNDAYAAVKALRGTIRPNSGFFGQLVEFEKRTTGKQTVFMVHSDYAPCFIPQLYEEDYRRLHKLRCSRVLLARRN